MHIETELKIDFNTTIGDTFDEETSKEDMKGSIEQHIQDFCNEHGIERSDVTATNELD